VAADLATLLPVYVIHVPHAQVRWRRMEEQLSLAGIVSYSRVDAVTYATVDDECRRHQITLARSIGKRDAAVALSHLRALRRLEADRVGMALVLEDDVLLTRRLPERLARVLNGAPPFDLFFAGWYSHLTSPDCTCRVPGRPDLRALWHDGNWGKQWWGEGPCVNTGMNGYVASASGAHRILRMMATMHSTIDTQLGDAASGPSPLRLLAPWPSSRFVSHNWSAPSIRTRGRL
jgi:GR25 family glycosyltransferase involved in LPS biosynthesis